MPKRKQWIVTASPARPLGDIVKDLKAAGFKVRHELGEIGSIVGEADEDAEPKLRTIHGVVDVSPDASIDIGPPDASKTW